MRPMRGNEDRKNGSGLDRLFHEPSRLGIMTVLCGSPEGLSFSELRKACSLTDGNLNRHLQTLQQAGVVRLRKSFVGSRPRTTIWATEQGRDAFVEYLHSLEKTVRYALEVTVQAKQRQEKAAGTPIIGAAHVSRSGEGGTA